MTVLSLKEIHDGLIMKRVQDHYDEAKQHFADKNIVGVFLQGSQNYTLDIPGSDVDTKCIVTPTLEDIARLRKPVSTTFIRENNEHVDEKDIRLYCECFRKQNLNFLEILFTPYSIINPLYAEQWGRLTEQKEAIARMNPFRAVKTMKGIALEKYHAMEHPYPSKLEVLAEYRYDPKQLHHLVRVDNYLTRFIAGESYAACLIPEEKMREFLLDIKLGKLPLLAARQLAELSLAHVTKIADEFCAQTEEKEDPEVRELLTDVQYNMIKIAIEEELK